MVCHRRKAQGCVSMQCTRLQSQVVEAAESSSMMLSASSETVDGQDFSIGRSFMPISELCRPPDHLRRHILAMREQQRKSNRSAVLSCPVVESVEPVPKTSNTHCSSTATETSYDKSHDVFAEGDGSDKESTTCSVSAGGDMDDQQDDKDLHDWSQPCTDVDLACSAALPPFVADGFSVTIRSVGGVEQQLDGLDGFVGIDQLCQRISNEFDLPVFAIRLLIEGQLYHSLSSGSLGEIGVEEGSEITIVQDWGWAKPNLFELEELQRKWTRQPRAQAL